jgi:hypothetical protein
MSYAKNSKGQLVPTSLAQAKQERIEFSCGVNAGKRAWANKSFDLFNKAKRSNDPWERGFKSGWNEGKNSPVEI